jgi:ribonucleotide monophosphatase NagD (HAD superfamily)
MVGAIAGSTKREPITVGKPAEFMLDNIARAFGLQRQQICMVGDRLDTDILFGKNGGLTTCLVLSGALCKGSQAKGCSLGGLLLQWHEVGCSSQLCMLQGS